MKRRTYLLFSTLFLLFSCKAYPPGSNGGSIPRPIPNGEAFLQAVRAADLDKIKEALKEGISIDYQEASNKDSALLLAILYDEKDSHKQVIEFLKEKNARKNRPNKVGITAEAIEDGKKKGKFLRTIRAGGRLFLLPNDCVSIGKYAEESGAFVIQKEDAADRTKTNTNETLEYAAGDTEPLGKGSQGTAFLVYKRTDWSIWAPKFPNAALSNAIYANHDEDFEEFKKGDLDVILSMKYGFENPVEVQVDKTPPSAGAIIGGIPYAMKSGITGGTLKERFSTGFFVIENGGDQFYKKNKDTKKVEKVAPTEDDFIIAEQMRKDLPELFMRMAQGKKAYWDLNPDNIMWKYSNTEDLKNGGQWVIIDAKAPDTKPYSFGEAWQKNTEYFNNKLPIIAKGKWDIWLLDWVDYATYKTWHGVNYISGTGNYLPVLTEDSFNKLREFFSGALKVDWEKLKKDVLPDKFSELTRDQKISIFLKAPSFWVFFTDSVIKEKQKEIREFIAKQALSSDKEAQDFLYFGIGNNELATHFSDTTPTLDTVREARNKTIKEIVEDSKNKILSLQDVLKEEHNRYRKALVMVPEADIINLGLAEDIKNKALAMRKKLLMLP